MNLTFPGANGAARILGASAVAVSGAADTNENTLGTITIPAGAMGLNGVLRLYVLWSYTNSANNKTLRVRLGGIGGTIYRTFTQTTSAWYSDLSFIANRGAANSQFGMSNAGVIGFSNGNALVTSAVDTAASTTLVVTGQKASAGETLTLEQYLVELILP